MRKAAICLLLTAILAGCGPAPAKRYFQMSIAEAATRSLPKIDLSLAVEPAAVVRLYDDVRILYRVSDFELDYYPYEFWAQSPGRLIDAAMADYFRKKPVFNRVVPFAPEGTQDITLRSRVHAIEEVDASAGWQAHLAMTLEFVDAKTGKVLVTHTFDKSARMAAKKVEDLPAALSQILEQELASAVIELAQAFEKKNG